LMSLLGRLLRLFPESVPLEDLFTEAIARLFETRPDVCLAWLKEIGALSPDCSPETLRVRSQRSFVSLDHHGTASRPDLLIEAYPLPEGGGEEASAPDVVMIESKIGSKEGAEQLRRYAEHLGVMSGAGKTLLYVTRAYDPKDEAEICRGLDSVGFVQLRWHDLYRFLQKTEKDALVEGGFNRWSQHRSLAAMLAGHQAFR
jgi:hypothetical protein